MRVWTTLLASLALALALGCGARSPLGVDAGESGEGGAGGGAAGGATPGDPDVECPVTCQSIDCLPPVLFEGAPVGWHAVDGGYLYLTTDRVEGSNQLIRVGVCGGTPEVLFETKRFSGYGHVSNSAVYVPVLEPPQVLRMGKDGSAPQVVHEHLPGDPLLTRAISSDHQNVYLSAYSFDGGLTVLRLIPGDDPFPLIASMPDLDWDPELLGLTSFVPNVPVRSGDWLVLGSALGLIKFESQWGGTNDISDAMEVGSPLAVDGDQVYVTDFSDFTEKIVKTSIDGIGDPSIEPTIVFPDFRGITVAARDGAVFLYERESVLRAEEQSLEVESLFHSEELVHDAFLLGQSVYIRTEQRVVRVATTCGNTNGDACFRLD